MHDARRQPEHGSFVVDWQQPDARRRANGRIIATVVLLFVAALATLAVLAVWPAGFDPGPGTVQPGDFQADGMRTSFEAPEFRSHDARTYGFFRRSMPRADVDMSYPPESQLRVDPHPCGFVVTWDSRRDHTIQEHVCIRSSTPTMRTLMLLEKSSFGSQTIPLSCRARIPLGNQDAFPSSRCRYESVQAETTTSVLSRERIPFSGGFKGTTIHIQQTTRLSGNVRGVVLTDRWIHPATARSAALILSADLEIVAPPGEEQLTLNATLVPTS